MRGCVFAENFISEDRVTANGGGSYGVSTTFARGMTIEEDPLNAGATFDQIALEGESTAVVRFSSDQLAAGERLLAGRVALLTAAAQGFAVWVDADGVKATYGDGVSRETPLEVDLDYSDGEIHTVSYSFNNSDSTHTLRVDALTGATATTTIDDDLTGWDLCVGGEAGSPDNTFIGTIYRARVFAAQLEAEEHAQYVNDDLVSFFEAPFAKYRCDDFGDDTNGHKVWCKGKANTALRDLGKGDQSSGDSPSFPTFWNKPYETGAYFFNGAFAYLSGLPDLPEEYTVTAVISSSLDKAAFPDFVSYEDLSTLLDALTTAGEFVGLLHNLVIWDGHLTPLQLHHAKYEQLYYIRRGWAQGLVARLHAENVLLFWAPLQAETMAFVDHAAMIQGTAYEVTKNAPDACTFESNNAGIHYEHNAIQQTRDGTIAVLGDMESMPTFRKAVVDKGLDYKFRVYRGVDLESNPVCELEFNGSEYQHPTLARDFLAVRFKFGDYPHFFVDGEYAGVGGSIVSPDNNSLDVVTVGNNNELNQGFQTPLKQVLITSAKLTDNEIIALRNNMHVMGASIMETGYRARYRDTYAGAVSAPINPGGPFQLIDVKFLCAASPGTSESATIKSVNADSDEFDEITAVEGNFTLTGMDKSQIYRFDKRFPDGTTLQVDYANTAAHCGTITLEVTYQLDDSVS